jgi:hypothetical protein
MDEPPAKRPPTTPETVPDDLDNATHQRMDDAVHNFLGNDPFIAYVVLSAIVSMSEGRLDAKYEALASAEALIDEHPQLRGMLESAWKTRSFKDLRRLSVLSFSSYSRRIPNVKYRGSSSCCL